MRLLLTCLAVLVLPAACRAQEPPAAINAVPPAGPVHAAVFEGTWYPGDAGELKTLIASLLGRAAVEVKAEGMKPRLIIAPHAGAPFCWDVAARAFKYIEGQKYDAVILLGCAHRNRIDGAAVYGSGTFANCLGPVPVEAALAATLVAAEPRIKDLPRAHTNEHSLEILVPFIQEIIGPVPIMPVLFGQGDRDLPAAAARALASAIQGRDVLVVVSTDLSHFPSAVDARKVDGRTVGSWRTRDPAEIRKVSVEQMAAGIPGLECTACGEEAVVAGFELARLAGWQELIITGTGNSAAVSGDSERTVGYASAVILGPAAAAPAAAPVPQPATPAATPETGKGDPMSTELFSEASKQELLAIARAAVTAAAGGQPPPSTAVTNPQLQAAMGCFVTLKKQGDLRGCIGRFEASQPLFMTVREMGRASATQDTRFDPVVPGEVAGLLIEISVLTPMRRIRDARKEFVLGKHGIYIRKGFHSGTYLPQVATEHHMSFEEFMSSCCANKAGLAPDAWEKDPGVELYTYEAVVFGEGE
ncbi:MAG: AmmeMemoRadiSam system protein B [Planctomycetota bacterium]